MTFSGYNAQLIAVSWLLGEDDLAKLKKFIASQSSLHISSIQVYRYG